MARWFGSLFAPGAKVPAPVEAISDDEADGSAAMASSSATGIDMTAICGDPASTDPCSQLPPGWTVHGDLLQPYYVNIKFGIKTWEHPNTEQSPQYFPRTWRATRGFNPNVPPPLPSGCCDDERSKGNVSPRLSIKEQGTSSDEAESEVSSDAPREFQYPLKVYIVYAPVRHIRSVRRLQRRAYASLEALGAKVTQRYIWWKKMRWVKATAICCMVMSILYIVGAAVVSFFVFFIPKVVIWGYRLGLRSTITFIIFVRLKRLFQSLVAFVLPTKLYDFLGIERTATATLGSRALLQLDEVSLSHWKVLIGPYCYELKIGGAEANILFGDEEAVEDMELQTFHPGPSYLRGNNSLLRTENEASNAITDTSSEQDYSNVIHDRGMLNDLSNGIRYQLQVVVKQIPGSVDPGTVVTTVGTAERRPLHTSGVPFRVRSGLLSVERCQCIKRILTKHDYKELEEEDWSWIELAETAMSDAEMDKVAHDIIQTWPPYSAMDSNCQAFALAFVDSISQLDLQSFSARMFVRYLGIFYLPDIINAGLALLLLLYADLYTGFLLTFSVALLALAGSFSHGNEAFNWLSHTRFGVNFDARLRQYWHRAAMRQHRVSSAYPLRHQTGWLRLIPSLDRLSPVLHVGIYTLFRVALFLSYFAFFCWTITSRSLIAESATVILNHLYARIGPTCGYVSSVRLSDALDKTFQFDLFETPREWAYVIFYIFMWPLTLYQMQTFSHDDHIGEESWLKTLHQEFLIDAGKIINQTSIFLKIDRTNATAIDQVCSILYGNDTESG